jgi:DNA-binding winged helix-turn-helix (wHTH) protein
VLRCGPFAVDQGQRLLFRGGVPLRLTPKAFDLFHLLVAEAPRVVTKGELHEQLWPGTFVSDSNLTGLVKELRRVLEDNDPEAPVIRTVHRVGYACGLEVAAERPEPEARHWLVLNGRRFVLQRRENVIGRDPASDVWVDVPGISRRHARITIDGTAVLLEDLGSKNGTTVGDARVDAAVVLRDGDRIRFGTVVGVYRTSNAGLSTETHSHAGR